MLSCVKPSCFKDQVSQNYPFSSNIFHILAGPSKDYDERLYFKDKALSAHLINSQDSAPDMDLWPFLSAEERKPACNQERPDRQNYRLPCMATDNPQY